MYMDIHESPAERPRKTLRRRTSRDVETQEKYGVEYHKYWINESSGKIFCLCSAPNPEAAAQVHREAHGLVASKIIEVAPEIAEGFLGGCEVNPCGRRSSFPAAPDNERDPGIRTVMFTDIVGSTELTQRLGDDAAMAVLEVHDADRARCPAAHRAAARSSTPETAS